VSNCSGATIVNLTAPALRGMNDTAWAELTAKVGARLWETPATLEGEYLFTAQRVRGRDSRWLAR
jgi:hypothetical protein